MKDLQIEICHKPDDWDHYVATSPGASTYHSWYWKLVIDDTYGHPTHYLTAYRYGTVEGVLPLVEMKSRLFGHFLVSLPFFNYGGLLADSEATAHTLTEHAAKLATELGARHVELRQGGETAIGWPSISAKVAMIVPLPKTADELWNGLSSRLRNKVRGARKHGFEVRWGGTELVGDFYKIFAVNMRNLGTPVYPRSWFENVFKHAGNHCKLLTLWEGNQPVAGTIATVFQNAVELPWIASSPEERKHYSTVLLYWTALEWAIQNGYRSVDLGRCTPGGGTHQFKKQWNCEEKPLHWYYWLAPGQELPNLRPDNPKYKAAIRVWQHLPLGLANWLGPRIVRSIP